jgi:nicotinamide-nucleotide adenylyltransferase
MSRRDEDDYNDKGENSRSDNYRHHHYYYHHYHDHNHHDDNGGKFGRGLMTGRFQPFHNGHLALARQMLDECNELVIVIGSAQFNFIEKDPFTAGERILMAHRALAESHVDLSRCYIIPVANDENNARWLAGLRSQVPPFDAIYSGNDFVLCLARLQDPSLVARKPRFAKKKQYNGTNIRNLIASGKKEWKNLVPPAVARVIEDVDGVERIKMVLQSDSNPAKW